ncbi:hypothetical protein [Aquimarina algiphila]|uniref:hypothetical protein n=1 Tax=Aquimarina algiphila TaxID=2047982 RepID=UPI00232AD1B5|nr:hypothetical protein [Aquimarina algiphila]
MEKTIEENLNETIKLVEKEFSKDDITKEFEEISKEFEDLVKQGLIKKRGNNLMSLSDLHLQKTIFNVK